MFWPFNRGSGDETDEERDSDFSMDDFDISVHNKGAGLFSEDRTGWLTTHTITLDESTTGETPADTQPAVGPEVGPKEPSLGDRTLGFPDDPDFMQKLESRGVNGAMDTVETVYILTGTKGGVPTDLFRVDHPEYFSSADATSVTSFTGKIAQKIAALYPDGETPGLVVRVHTHPNGTTTPSSEDRDGAASTRDPFEREFGTSDFRFFQAIHGLSEHNRNPPPAERQQPKARSNTVSWDGERYHHDFAVFDKTFNPLRVEVLK